MNVSSSSGAASAQATAALMQLLRTAQQAPVELVEKLIAASAEGEVAAQKMQTTQQILDVYA